MKLTIRLMTFSLFVLSCCAFGQPNGLKARIDQLVLPWMQQNQIPGVAVAIHYNGQDAIYTYGYADREAQKPVTGNTIFELASVTKIFTTSLLATSIQEGKVKLSDPIAKYLPALSGTQGLPIDSVKVVDLATHSASFPRDIEGFGASKQDETGFYRQLTTWQPQNPIGSNYLYSNVGFGLLGKALANANGQDFSTLLRNEITGPLGMTNTFVQVPSNKIGLRAQGYNARGGRAPFYQPGFLYGGGALRSSASDLLKFMNANLGIGNNPKLQTAFKMTQHQYFAVRPNFNMGLGWQRLNRLNTVFITKNGGNQGFSTFIGFSPQSQFGVVVLMNKRKAMAGKLGNQILNVLQNRNGAVTSGLPDEDQQSA